MESQPQAEAVAVQARRAGYITPKQARLFFESRPGLDAIRNWMKRGVHNRKVKDSKVARIKLRSICEGAMFLTRPEWIEQFKIDCQNNHK